MGSSWREEPTAGIILRAGNSVEYKTGSWRTYRPIWDAQACINCFTCFIFCPDSAIMVKDGKVVGIDYDHCKGCGICANECPPKASAIKMVLESEARSLEKKE